MRFCLIRNMELQQEELLIERLQSSQETENALQNVTRQKLSLTGIEPDNADPVKIRTERGLMGECCDKCCDVAEKITLIKNLFDSLAVDEQIELLGELQESIQEPAGISR